MAPRRAWSSRFLFLPLLLWTIVWAPPCMGERCTEAVTNLCCAFPMYSREFNECCYQIGCCPYYCPGQSTVTIPRTTTATIRTTTTTTTPGCSAAVASICCRFPMFSQEFNNCCNNVGCCPTSCPGQTTTATVPYKTTSVIRPTTGCSERDARQCCRFLMFSDEFFVCCDEMKCCPTSCPQILATTTDPATTNITTTELTPNCQLAQRCCRFPPASYEFVWCCEQYRCKPNCYSVEKGCCYNGRNFAWGKVVEVFEDACVELVCAAQPSQEPTFITSKIFTLRIPDCLVQGCDSCLDVSEVCIDETGLARYVGEEWHENECHVCKCKEKGNIKCRHEVPRCPKLPPIPPKCTVEEGPCCSWLKCPVGRTCRDAYGQEHSLYARWKSNPCTSHQCTLAGITTTRQTCDPPPHPNCIEAEEEEEGSSSEEGDSSEGGVSSAEYEPKGDECCPKWKCGPDCRLVRCSFIPPGEDCELVFEPLACCPKWNCSGCVDDNKAYYPLGLSWNPTPCTSLTCTPLGIVNTTEPCKPKPLPECTVDTYQEGCCPVYDCGGCMDKNNEFHPMFSRWKVGHCSFLECTPRGIVPVEPDCPEKPQPNCYEGELDEKCCPKWECGTDCRTVKCEGPPTTTGCTPYYPPYACCPEWRCSGCVDEAGRQRPVGSVWRTDDPCVNNTCAENGEVVSVAMSCAPLGSPPRKGCYQHTAEGECCPKWNCSGCLDDYGVFHPLYQSWSTDACTNHFCSAAGIYSTTTDCPTLSPQPHPNCELKVTAGSCCQDWVCGQDCRLVFCAGRPEGGYCVSHRPPLSCCDVWTCSGCIDEDGKPRSVGDFWVENTCLLHKCTTQGIVTTNQCLPYYDARRKLEQRRRRELDFMFIQDYEDEEEEEDMEVGQEEQEEEEEEIKKEEVKEVEEEGEAMDKGKSLRGMEGLPIATPLLRYSPLFRRD